MEIVIDIDEEEYKTFMNGKDIPVGVLCGALYHGTPLPKGHGRLIDADATIEIQSGTHFEVIVGKAKIEKHSIDELIKASNSEVPTIIPADKEAEKQVTGRWIRKMDAYRGGYVECSVCGTPYKYIDPKELKTCMLCHARMEESE